MQNYLACVCIVWLFACGGDGQEPDAAPMPIDATPMPIDATPMPIDATPAPATISELRNDLFVGNPDLGQGADVCQRWNSLDSSRKAVFLTNTHRLYSSTTPDDLSMLHHIERLLAMQGGGADGSECGGIDNNRLFMAMDGYLWDLMVQTWNDILSVGDGGGRDLAAHQRSGRSARSV